MAYHISNSDLLRAGQLARCSIALHLRAGQLSRFLQLLLVALSLDAGLDAGVRLVS